MNLNYDYSALIVECVDLLQRGHLEKTNDKLLTTLMQHPLGRGAADALHMVGIVHMKTLDHHRSEAACLLAWRLRATLIDENLTFDTLVNASRACMNLKSFEEAHYYGTLAESLRDEDDADLLSNMVASASFTGRDEEAQQRLEKLKRFSSDHAAYITSLIRGETNFQPTHTLSCADLLESFEQLKTAPPSEFSTKFKDLLAELQRRPDGREAWRCWRIVCEIHQAALPKDPQEEYLQLQQAALMASAAGKAIYQHPDNAGDDATLWAWRGQTLGQMCLYDQSLEAVKKAYEIDPSFPNIRQNIAYTEQMNSYPAESLQRPDSKAWLKQRMAELQQPSSPTRDHIPVEEEARKGRFHYLHVQTGPPMPGLGTVLIITLCPQSMGTLALKDQQQVRSMLQKAAKTSRLEGSVIPVWQEDDGLGYLAPQRLTEMIGANLQDQLLSDLWKQRVSHLRSSECALVFKARSGGCFIATAASGSATSWQVKELQQFRDTLLARYRPGLSFIFWYYRWSPPIAESIAARPFVRAAVRILISLPALGHLIAQRGYTLFTHRNTNR